MPKSVRPTSSKDILFAFFLALLILVPLPFGCNRPWASDLCALLSGFLLIALASLVYRETLLLSPSFPARRLGVSAALIALVVAWIGVQQSVETPAAWHSPLWEKIGAFIPATSGVVSVAPDLASGSLARLASAISFFLLSFILCHDRKRAELLLKTLAGAAVAYALYGLIEQATGEENILGIPKWAYQGFVTSTFVNKNSYATYAGFGFLCCLALAQHKISFQMPQERTRSLLISAFLLRLGSTGIFYLLACFIVLSALVMTGSRGGFISLLVGVTAFVGSLSVARRSDSPSFVSKFLALWILSALGLALFLSGNLLFHRFSAPDMASAAPIRLTTYKIIVQALIDHPWQGFGLGSFDAAFPLYRDATVQAWMQHAHNDYLEMAMDLGIPAALMLFISLMLLTSCCLQGIWRRQQDRVFPAMGFAASLLAATHALVDFSFQIPAVSLTYAAILGLGVAQSWSTRIAPRRL